MEKKETNKSNEINVELLKEIRGGESNGGWIDSFSGECNGGTSCWDLVKECFGG